VALALALASAASACNFAGTRAHNLEVLHDPAGRHQRFGAIMSDFEYIWRVGLTKGVPGARAKGAGEEEIKNPLALCVSNMSELADFKSEKPRTRSLQVLNFARFAVDDPWNLSREAAVRSLGEVGEGLEVPIESQREGDPAGVEEVRDAIARLLNAARSTLNFGELDPTLPEDDLAAACERIDTMPLDRDGALRLLRAGAMLESRTSARDERVAPLRATLVGLQRVCVREALQLALQDNPPRPVGSPYAGWESPRVRAAAVSACVRTFGEGALADFLRQLPVEPSPEVATAIVGEIRARGLPRVPPGLAPEDAEGLRESWIESILQVATDNPDGTARITAMLALQTISDGAVRSLREEDWLAWHRTR